MKADRRWWNDGRYASETAAFDVAQPLSRETWESLQRSDREQAHRMACEPFGPSPLRFIRATTESGLEIRIKLDIQFPTHIGIAYI